MAVSRCELRGGAYPPFQRGSRRKQSHNSVEKVYKRAVIHTLEQDLSKVAGSNNGIHGAMALDKDYSPRSQDTDGTARLSSAQCPKGLLLPHFAPVCILRLTSNDRVYSKCSTIIKVASIIAARYWYPAETWPVAQVWKKNPKRRYRHELFFADSSHKNLDVWVDGPDSATQNLGSTSVDSLSASFGPELPHEQVNISEVESSLARTSTVAHHCFERHPGPCSALHQHTGQHSRSYTRRARESSHRRTFVAYLQTGDVWNTSLADQMDDLAVTVDEDIWLTLLNEDEYANLQYLRETPLYEPYQQDELLDSAFDELIIDHAQWMKELEEDAEIGTLDRLATSYDICVCFDSNALAAHSKPRCPDLDGSLPSIEATLLQDAVLLALLAKAGRIFVLALPPPRTPLSAPMIPDSLDQNAVVSAIIIFGSFSDDGASTMSSSAS
ncbi:hypothetical protein PTTW11_05574 [Pyrenophora teres f. teres]|nr:hypothetical protein PTTW11_05574 [Pyrenophora teres f. teres]